MEVSLPATSAAGYVIGVWESAGKVPTTATFFEIAASVEYTMPSGHSPRSTRAKAARTLSARASLPWISGHTPNFSRAIFAYLPAGTWSGSPVAKRSCPNSFARGNPGLTSIF